MKTLPPDATDDDLLAAAREWVSLLVDQDYEAATAFIYQPNPHASFAWTPDRIQTLINNYGSTQPMLDGRKFVVTPLADAREGSTPTHEVHRVGATEGDIWFDLPLNGQWSDLTALFNFIPHEGHIVLQLEDIHVM